MQLWKAMTLNTQFGAEDRFERMLDLIAREQPDLLVLQECVDWDDGQRLAAVAAALGLPAEPAHIHLGRARARPSGRRYHVAIASRLPILSARDHADPKLIGHCLAEVEIDLGTLGPATVFGAHFDAHDEDLRLTEVRYLHSLLDFAAFQNRPYMLLGDLNSISRRDPYPFDLAERVRAAGMDKYGHPPRFEVIGELEAAGWIDALSNRASEGQWVTAERNYGDVRLDFRTDYIFVSPWLAKRLLGTRIIDTTGISDHHAVVSTFEL